MNLIIYINEHYEEEQALYDLEKKEAILQGDYYHDKISPKIDGYLEALEDHGIYTKEVPVEYMTREHELYEKLNFYDEELDG